MPPSTRQQARLCVIRMTTSSGTDSIRQQELICLPPSSSTNPHRAGLAFRFFRLAEPCAAIDQNFAFPARIFPRIALLPLSFVLVLFVVLERARSAERSRFLRFELKPSGFRPSYLVYPLA